MPIKVPTDAKIVRDRRLDFVRIVKLLYARAAKSAEAVKESLEAKEAEFAQGDLAMARLQPGGVTSAIDPKKFFSLAKEKKLTAAQQQSCCSINKEPLKEFFNEREIESISKTTGTRESSLTVETRPDVTIDIEGIETELVKLIESTEAVRKAA